MIPIGRTWPKLLVMGATLAALGFGLSGGERVALADTPGTGPHLNRGDLIVQVGHDPFGGSQVIDPDHPGLIVVSPVGESRGYLNLVDHEGPPEAFNSSGYLFGRNYPGGVSRYPHSGGDPSPFTILPAGQSLGVNAAVFDNSGNLYVGSILETDGQPSVSGVFRFTSTGQPSPLGIEVPAAYLSAGSPNGLGLSGCTLTYARNEEAKRFDICTQTQLADFPTLPGLALAKVRGYSAGYLIKVDEFTGEVWRINQDGTVQSYPTNYGCAVAADAIDDTLYILDHCDRAIYRYGLTSGLLIDTAAQFGQNPNPLDDLVPIDFRVYDQAAPPKPVIYVHGVTTPANNSQFGAIEALLIGPAPATFSRFVYFQDAFVAPGASCNNMPPVANPSSSIVSATWHGSNYSDACDSQADIGLNAIKLSNEVDAAFASSGGQRVVLLGYSMGAAIIRGMIDYRVELDPATASSRIDSAIFVAGAHHGSFLANALVTPGVLQKYTNRLNQWAAAAMQVGLNALPLSLSRPAAHQLAVNSDWYDWANAPARPLPADIGYYNAYGDMVVTDETCVDLYFWDDCWSVELASLGDAVLHTGTTNDPYEGPLVGGLLSGSKFSRQSTVEQWQWALTGEFDVKKWKVAVPLGPVHEVYRFGSFLANSPLLHTRIPDRDAEILLTQCGSASQVSLRDQLEQVLLEKVGRAGGRPCPTH